MTGGTKSPFMTVASVWQRTQLESTAKSEADRKNAAVETALKNFPFTIERPLSLTYLIIIQKGKKVNGECATEGATRRPEALRIPMLALTVKFPSFKIEAKPESGVF